MSVKKHSIGKEGLQALFLFVLRPPQGLAPLCKGSWQGRQALTEGLWVAYRNGLTVTGCLLLRQTYNPSASHSLSTSPFDRGRFCGNAGRHRKAGRARSDGRNHVPPVNPLLFGRRTGDGAFSEKKRSPAADAGLGCRRRHPINGRTGGPGGISPLVQRPPGGLSVHFPPVESGRFPRKTGFAGAPVDLTASVAAESAPHSVSDGRTPRRSCCTGAFR